MSEPATVVKARKLLSECLKSIGQEETELVDVDGSVTTVTKIEGLARTLWKLALGGIMCYRNEKQEVVQEFCRPDRQTAKLMFEYMEGKPKSQDVPPGGKGARQGEFDAQTKTRLANILSKQE
jgi:hypothetical protein